jgi:hypothetical protein
MDTNIFETASRSKLRFQFKGLLSTEDLWDLSVEQLDYIFKGLNAQVKLAKEESLLGTPTRQEMELSLRVEIIKHIFQTKMAEQEVILKIAERKQQKQKLLGLLAEKQDADLKNKSVDELAKMIEELG